MFSELHSDADALEILKARDEKCALKENKESEGARERSLSFYQMVCVTMETLPGRVPVLPVEN